MPPFQTPQNRKKKAKPEDFDNALLRQTLAQPKQEEKSELPLADWRKLEVGKASNQASREGHTSDCLDGHLYIFGGLEFGRRSNSFLALNMETLKWRTVDSLNVPRERCYHASASWGTTIFIQGGEGLENPEEKMERGGRFGSLLRTRNSSMRETGGSVASPTKTRRSSQHSKGGHGGHGSSHGHGHSHTHGHNAEEEKQDHPPPSRVNTISVEGRPNAILLDDLHAYDTTTQKWTQVLSSLSPLPTKCHTMVCVAATSPRSDAADDQSQALEQTAAPYLVCFGGTSQYSSSMTDQMSFCRVDRALGGEAVWEACAASGDGPCGRSGHTMTPLSKHSFAIFGGVDSKDEFLNDLFIYEAREHSWSTIKECVGDMPPPMSAHAAIAHRQSSKTGMMLSNRLLVYGGSCMVPDDSVTVEGDLVGGLRETTSHDAYIFDVDDARWLKLTHGPIYPNPRRGHSMAVLHGWRPNWFEPENWGFKARYGILAPNMPKVAHIDDPDDDGHPPVFAVVYGGINSLYCNSDTWLLDIKPFVVARLEPVMPYPRATAPDPNNPANMTPIMKKRLLHSQSATSISFAGEIDLGAEGGMVSPAKLIRERKESTHLIHTLRKETKDAQTQFKQELERRRAAEAARDQAIADEKATREDLNEREAQLRATETKLVQEEALSAELRELRDEALHMLQLLDMARPLDMMYGDADDDARGYDDEADEEVVVEDGSEVNTNASGARGPADGKAGTERKAEVQKVADTSDPTVVTGEKGEVREVDLRQEVTDAALSTVDEGGSGSGTEEPFEAMARSLQEIWENDDYIKMVRNATFQETIRRMDAPLAGAFDEETYAEFRDKYKLVARNLLRWEASLFGPPKTAETTTATTPRLSVANQRVDREQVLDELEDLFAGHKTGTSIAMARTNTHLEEFVGAYDTASAHDRLLRSYQTTFELMGEGAPAARVFESEQVRLTRDAFVERFAQLGLPDAAAIFVALRSVAPPTSSGEAEEEKTVGRAELTEVVDLVRPLDAAVNAGKAARVAILALAEEAVRQQKEREDAAAAKKAAELAAAKAEEEDEEEEDEEDEVFEEVEDEEVDGEEVEGSQADEEGEGEPQADSSSSSGGVREGGEEGKDDGAGAAANDEENGEPSAAAPGHRRPKPSSQLATFYEALFLQQKQKEEEQAAAVAATAAAAAAE